MRRTLQFFTFCLFVMAPATAGAWLIEAGSVNLPAVSSGSTSFVTVNLRQTYPSTPVIVLVPGDANSRPNAIRIRNVTSTSFEVAQVEPAKEDGVQPADIVHYLAIEPGSHQFPDGTRLEAGTTVTSAVQHGTGVGGPESWASVSFSAGFIAAPVVLGQIQTMNNESGTPPGAVSSPWLTTVIQTVSATGFQTALERSEVNSGLMGTSETIGWVAITAGVTGNFTDSASNTVNFETIFSANNIRGWVPGNSCYPVNFTASYSTPPLVLATKDTHYGGDGGWLRRCSLSTTAVGLTVHEDEYKDVDYHTNEQAGVAIFSQAFDADLTPPPPSVADTAWKMEAGSISLAAINSGDVGFTTVTFQQSYAAAPLVFLLTANENPEPAAARIRNVTASGFEIVPVEPPNEDGAQPASTLHYLAVEPGLHQMPDGTIVEAGTISTPTVQSNPATGNGWNSVILNGSFSAAPALLATIQTMNNETAALPGAPSTPWLATAVRNVTSGGFQLALERAETGTGPVATPERIAYLAITSGISGNFKDVNGTSVVYESIYSGNIIRGWNNGCFTVNFVNTYTAAPLVIANQATRNGNNGGWLRRCSLSATAVGLTVDEDQANDSERNHIQERGGIAVFSQAFAADFGQLAWWRLDEASWTGAAGEVVEQTGNYNGTANNGATTASATPALTGDPGTCGYGTFDGANDYLAIPGFPNLTSDFTITAWFNTAKKNKAGQRIFTDDENNSGGYAISVGDGGTGRVRFFARGTSPVSLDTGNVVNNNRWYFVAAVADITNGIKRLYIYDSGFTQMAAVNSVITGTWGTDNGIATIGGESDLGETAYRFQGMIDEVRLFKKAMSQGDIETVMHQTHPCPPPTTMVDHYEIIHDASALTCEPETVTIRACQDAACATLYSGAVSLTLSPTGWVGGDTITFTGGSTTAALRHSTAGDITLGITAPVPAASYICIQGGVTADCVMTFHDSGFAFTIPDQTAGKDSAAITIAAVRKDLVTEQCVPAFANRTVNVDFWSTYSTPGTGTMVMTVNGTPVATASPGTSLSLTFDANGESTLVLNYPDAGEMALDASFTGIGAESGLIMTGSDTFVSVPAGLCVEATEANNDCAAGNAGCSAFVAAGSPFNLQVRAVAWETTGEVDTDFCTGNSVTPNYQATGITISHTKIAPAGGAAGTIGATTFDMLAGDNGVHDINQTVSEVGVFRLSADPPAYLTAGDLIPTSTSANIGRFIPARFTVSLNPDPPTVADSCLVGNFTWLGQPFTYTIAPQITITAQNSNGATTVNYDCGGFWKLSSPWNLNYTYADVSAPVSLSPATSSATAAAGSDSDCNGSVTLTLNDSFTYTRPGLTAPVTPFAASIDLNIPAARFTDSDSVCYDPGSGCAGISRNGIIGANLLHGQGLANNAYGPETASVTDPLLLPVSALSYNGSDWQTNSADSCTSVNLSKGAETGITVNNPTTPLTLSAGVGEISLYPTADPNPPGGSAEINLDFPAWLEPDLTVEAYFGIYRGNDRIINWQEIVR